MAESGNEWFIRKDIMTVIRSGNTDELASLLDRLDAATRKDALLETPYPLSPIACAINSGKIAIVRLLVEKYNVDVNHGNSGDKHERNALCDAVYLGDIALVNYLLEKGAHVNKADQTHRAPLAIACATNKLPLVDRLISAGASVNVTDKKQVPPLVAACRGVSCKDGQSILVRLLKKRADCDLKTPSGQLLLYHALDKNDTTILALLSQLNENMLAGKVLTKENCSGCIADSPIVATSFSREEKVQALKLYAAYLIHPKHMEKSYRVLLRAMNERSSGNGSPPQPVSELEHSLLCDLESKSRGEFKRRKRTLDPDLLMECLMTMERMVHSICVLPKCGESFKYLVENGLRRDVAYLLKCGLDISKDAFFWSDCFMMEKLCLLDLSSTVTLSDAEACLEALLKYSSQNLGHASVERYLKFIPFYLGRYLSCDGNKDGELKSITKDFLHALSVTPYQHFNPLNQSVHLWCGSKTDHARHFFARVIEFLIECEADTNARDPMGRTPFHILAGYSGPDVEGALRIADALQEAGALFSVLDAEGRTPLDVAEAEDKMPLNLETVDKMKEKMGSNRPFNLVYLAAHAVLKRRIPLDGSHPSILRNFVRDLGCPKMSKEPKV